MRSSRIQRRAVALLAREAVRDGRGVDGLIRLAVQCLAGAYIVGFIVAAFFRLSYPYALQLTEPATLTEIERILHGQALYVRPSLEYAPMIYGPVYFYVSAAVAVIVGDGYAPLRLVSLVASMGTVLVIGRLVSRETGSLGAGLIAGGLYAATFPFSDTGLDVGRVDALFTLWLFAAIYAARRATLQTGQIDRSLAASGIFLGLAALTKLPLGVLPVGLAICAAAAIVYRARAIIVLLAAVVSVAIGLVLLGAPANSWPTWYMWDLPRLHEIRPNLVGRFWFTDLLPRLTIALLVGPVFVLVRLLERDWRPLFFYVPVTGSVLVLSWASRANGGGAPNVLLPAFAMAAVLCGIGVHAAASQITGVTWRAQVFRAYIFGLCAVQLCLLVYNPRVTVPYRSDQWADERLAARLASLPAPIFAIDLDAYMHDARDSGHPMFGPIGEIQGAFGGPGTAEGRALAATLRQRLRSHEYRYVVAYDKSCCLNDELAAAGYKDIGPLFPLEDVFYEWKSWRTPEPEVFAYAEPS